jgi:hypothetical protein
MFLQIEHFFRNILKWKDLLGLLVLGLIFVLYFKISFTIMVCGVWSLIFTAIWWYSFVIDLLLHKWVTRTRLWIFVHHILFLLYVLNYWNWYCIDSTINKIMQILIDFKFIILNNNSFHYYFLDLFVLFWEICCLRLHFIRGQW